MNKEVEINNKRHARIRIWAFACEWHQPPDPHFISESSLSLFFCGTAPLGRFVVGLVPTVSRIIVILSHGKMVNRIAWNPEGSDNKESKLPFQTDFPTVPCAPNKDT